MKDFFMRSMKSLSRVILCGLMVFSVAVNAGQDGEKREKDKRGCFARACAAVTLALGVVVSFQGNYLIDNPSQPPVIACPVIACDVEPMTGQPDTSTQTQKLTCRVGPNRVRFYLGQKPCDFDAVTLLLADRDASGRDACYVQDGNRAMRLSSLTPEILDLIKLKEEKKSKKNN